MSEATERQATTPERVAVLRAMPYDEYLRTAEWQATRQRALARARHSCQICGSRSRLNVHHNTYARRGNEEDRDLIVLCGGEDGCHALYHRQGRLAAAPRSLRDTGSPILSLPQRIGELPDGAGRPATRRSGPLRPHAGRPRGKRPPRWLRRIAPPVRIGAGLLLLGLLILIIARHSG